MTHDEALNQFGELLDSFFPAKGRGPSWAQYPYSHDVDAAVNGLKDAGVTFEDLERYVKGSWDIGRDGRLTTSDRTALTGLLEHISAKRGGN